MKITEKLGEFQKFIDSDNKTGFCLEDTLEFFDIQCIFGQFELVKQHGKQAAREGSKNPYYDLLGNEHINWRTILYLYAKQYLRFSGRIAEYSGKIRVLIFDDNPIEKSRKKIEACQQDA